ncbi:MAG: PASTA domain-containing protein [Stackebrandtia sp.]
MTASKGLLSGLAVLLLGLGIACGSGDADAGDSQAADAPATESADPTEADSTDDVPAQLEMPSVIGENAAVAKDELDKLGFTSVEFGSVDSDHDTLGVVNPANWTVSEQSHEAGDLVDSDAVIVLGCVKN